MRTITTLLATPLILILGISAPARAQDRHAVPPSALAAAVTDHAATLDADRDAVREALNRPEVRAVAERTGIDIDRAAASIDNLDSSNPRSRSGVSTPGQRRPRRRRQHGHDLDDDHHYRVVVDHPHHRGRRTQH